MGYSSACLAAEKTSSQFPDRTIEVLDSRKAAIAEGFVAIRAAKSAAAGKHMPEVLQAAREACRKTNIVATLDTLEYLERGGRIGKLNFMLGSLIDIKPILSIDVDGDLKPLRKVRGESQALEAIVDQVVEDVSGCQQLHLAVIAADAPEKAERLKVLALEKLQPDEIFYTELTPVMGVHAGPGSLGLGYYYT
jgi:DegV family protein with EDD domain